MSMFKNLTRAFALQGVLLIACNGVALYGQELQKVGEVGKPANNPTSAVGAVPRLINFNGILRDRSGRPLSGTVGLSFALYKDQEGGAPLWVEIQNVQVDDQGRYGVLLGSTQAEGLPMELFTSGESRWLGIQPQLPGEQEIGRALLVSVPYALKAADADTIGGKPASAFMLAPDPGTASDTPRKSNMGDGPITPAASGSGTQDFLARWTDNSGALGDSIIKQSLGNIGVGTETPAEKLEVNGNLRLFGQSLHAMQITGAASSGRLGQDGTGFFFASDTPGKAVSFYTSNGSLNEAMRVTSTGNGGIVIPGMLRRPYEVWMRLAYVLGWINTRIIMGIVFYGVFTPAALIMRFTKKDPMNRTFDSNADTYRVPCQRRSATHMRHQF